MRKRTLLALFAGVLVVAGMAHVESAAAQRSRQKADRSERSQPKAKDIPLPERPVSAAKTSTEKPKDGEDAAEASIPDEWPQEEIASALRDCVRLLAPIAAEVDVTVPIKSGACGAPAPVRLRRIGVENPVTLSPPATINCPMVVALHRWVETQLQPHAQRILGSHVVSLSNVSAYSCRLRNGSKSGKLSEHGLANAIDIGRFETADGQTVTVAADWGPTQRDIKKSATAAGEGKRSKVKDVVPPAPRALTRKKAARKARSVRPRDIPLPERRPDPRAQEPDARSDRGGNDAKPAGGQASAVLKLATSKKAQFLKKIHEEACGVFGTVLGPEANDAHRDHFHFDLAPRRRRAFCE